MPTLRYLKGYTIDPGFSTQLDTVGINEMIYCVKWEQLLPGPIGEYVEVIDLDPTNNYFYEPVDLDSVDLSSQHGLSPSEGNAQFHQQFIYAVVMQTIEHFEKSLGRKIIWKARTLGKSQKRQYVRRLRIYPHAMRYANAFYTEEKVALLFGYFEAGSKIEGSNFPGGTVFTCLSPDIVAHETTHAILDSIHPRYLENTNPDVPAFHEAFADIVALLQRFANTRLVEHQLERTRGRLDEFSILGELATQFGQALKTGRGALRSAIGQVDPKTGRWKRKEPDPLAYQNIFECHQRGAILVATIFDAFMRLYNFRIKDLLRIATQGSGVLPLGAIHPDLVKRLAMEVTEIALHLLTICIRALDYCPPFDITFGSYLRALITADVDICPSNENTYRVSLIEAFRAWGIFPDRVFTLSTYSLPWKAPDLVKREIAAMRFMSDYLHEEIQVVLGLKDRKQIWLEYSSLQSKFHNFLLRPENHNFALWRRLKLTKKIWEKFLEKLGLVFEEVTHQYEDSKLVFSKNRAPIEVHSIRPALRYGLEVRQNIQVIVTLTQTIRVKGVEFGKVKFRGGSTIVFSLSENGLDADYIIVKSMRSNRRLKEQLDYQLGKTSKMSLALSPYQSTDDPNTVNFENLHLH